MGNLKRFLLAAVNSAAIEGMGKLGVDQLAWLNGDLMGRSSSTPIVVFAHLPLWTIAEGFLAVGGSPSQSRHITSGSDRSPL
jgi:hypothetical protein